MPQGDKSKYTDKQKRMAEHILRAISPPASAWSCGFPSCKTKASWQTNMLPRQGVLHRQDARNGGVCKRASWSERNPP